MGRVISTCIQFIDAFTNPSKQTIDSMRRMGTEARKAGKQIQSAGKTISKAGSALTKSITMPIAGIATVAVKTAADYESAMSNVKAITGATGKDFESLNQLGKDLGASTAWSAKQVAEAMQYTGMAGWTAKDNVEGLKGILDLASASGTDLAATSDIMTDAISAFGYKASDSAKFADTMTKACTSANVSVETLGESYKYCGAISGTMGYSIDEVTTSLAAMGNMGIKGSQAGTTLKNAISNMAAPTKNMKAAMDDLGISIVNQDGSMKSWGDVIKNLQSSFGGLTQDQQAAYAKQLFGKESMAGMLAIINTSVDDYNALGDAIKNSGGAAEDAANTQLDNLNGQLTLLKSALEGAAITIGNKLTPYLKQAVSWVQKATDWFNGLSDAQVENIMKWAGIAATIGPVLLIFGKAVFGIGTLYKKFGDLKVAIAGAKGAIGLLTSPAGIVIGVLAAIALAAVLVIKNWDKIKPVIMNVKDWFVSTFGGTIKAAITGFKDIFTKVMQGIKDIMPTVTQVIKSAISMCIPIFNTIVSVIKVVVETVKRIAPIIATTFVAVAQKLTPVFKTIGNVIKAVIPIIGKLLSNAFTFVGRTIQKVSPYITKIASVISNILGYAIKKISPIIVKLASTFSTVFNSIFKVVSAVVKKLRPVFNAIGTVIKTVMEVVKTNITITFSTVANVISTCAGSIKQIIDGIAKVFSGILDFITGVFTGNWKKAWEGVKSIFGGIFDGLAGLCKTPINAVIGVINTAIKGINSISIDIPKGVPIIGGKHIGFNIPTIPALAKGTPDWKGGLAQINEKGGEIVDLPRGTRVYPHDKSLNIAKTDGIKQASGTATKSLNIANLGGIKETAKGFIENIKQIATGTAKNLADGIKQASGMATKSLNIVNFDSFKKSADDLSKTFSKKLKTYDKEPVRPKEKKSSTEKRDINITIPKLAEQIIVREESDIDKTADRLANKLRDTALNMGVA